MFAACRQQKDCDALARDEGLETVLIDYSKPDTIAAGLEHVLGKTGGTLDALFNNGAYAMGCAAEAGGLTYTTPPFSLLNSSPPLLCR